MSADLGQEYSRGNGYIQGRSVSGHRNETAVVRAFEVFTRNTIFLRSHDQTDRATQVGLEKRCFSLFCAGYDLQTGVLHELYALL